MGPLSPTWWDTGGEASCENSVGFQSLELNAVGLFGSSLRSALNFQWDAPGCAGGERVGSVEWVNEAHEAETVIL